MKHIWTRIHEWEVETVAFDEDRFIVKIKDESGPLKFSLRESELEMLIEQGRQACEKYKLTKVEE